MSDERIGQSGLIGLSGATVRGVGTGLVIALALLVLFWGRLVNHDIAWFLIATREWLGGAQLYVDLVEVNPPLNFYLTVPSLMLADLFCISDTNGHYLAMALLCLASLLWSSLILASTSGLSPARQAMFLLGAGAAVLLSSLNGIGQREQVLVLCFLPWALREASPHGVTTAEQTRAAAFAAIGMCLKPYFVVMPLAVTLLNCLQARSFRPILSPANITFLIFGLAYVFLVWIVHPTYLFVIVGYGLEVYGAYGKPFAEVLTRIAVALGPMTLLSVIVLRSKTMNRPALVFVALSWGGLVSYFLQGTGFSYHKVPFLVFGMIACLLVLLQGTGERFSALVAAVAAGGMVLVGVHQGFYHNDAIPEITETAGKLGEIDGLMTLSSHVYAGPPVAISLGTGWISSYPANWLVPGASNRLNQIDCKAEAQLCQKLEEIAARNRRDNIADIAKARPDLLIVDRNSGYFDKPRFDWLGFMAADPDWAPVFADYRQVATSPRFLYFKRKP